MTNLDQEIKIGNEIEHEHTNDRTLANIICMDHLREDPHYYSKLMAAGLGNEKPAQQIAQVDRAKSGQDNLVKPVAPPIPAGVEAPANKSPLKSSGLGVGAPQLKSSDLKTNGGKNQVSPGKTIPKNPEPSVETAAGTVNKTTGANIPHGVVIKKTPPIGGSSMSQAPKVSTGDVLDHFCGQMDLDTVETNNDGPLEISIDRVNLPMGEALNHLGEREFQTYEGWKAAVKKMYPNMSIEGNKDIAQASVGGKGVAEWDGAVGSIYNPSQPIKTTKEGTTPHTFYTKKSTKPQAPLARPSVDEKLESNDKKLYNISREKIFDMLPGFGDKIQFQHIGSLFASGFMDEKTAEEINSKFPNSVHLDEKPSISEGGAELKKKIVTRD